MWHLLDTWVVSGHETSSVIVVWVHVCVRSLDSCTESDNHLSFCLCDWSTRDTRDHHCPGLFLVQTFLFSQQTTWWLVVTLPIRMWGLREREGEERGQILSWTNLEDIDCIDFGGSPLHPTPWGRAIQRDKGIPGAMASMTLELPRLWLPSLYLSIIFLIPHRKRLDKGLLSNLTQQVGPAGHLQ